MLVMNVHFLAVLLVTVISMAIGWLWYSPVLFGKVWLKALGKTPADMAAMNKGSAMPLVLELLATFVKMYALAVFISSTSTTTAGGGVLVALWLWLGVVVTTNLSVVTFEGRSKGAYLVGIACQLVSLVIAGMVLAVWQ